MGESQTSQSRYYLRKYLEATYRRKRYIQINLKQGIYETHNKYPNGVNIIDLDSKSIV